MKKFLIFIVGFISGVFVTFLGGTLIAIGDKPIDEGVLGLTVFPEKGDCIPTKNEIEVMHVIEPNMALASTGNRSDGIIVLLIDYDGNTYYDQQKVKISKNECVRQIGTYQYTTRMNDIEKTVPAVVIE